jgi:hypothetical protein
MMTIRLGVVTRLASTAQHFFVTGALAFLHLVSLARFADILLFTW